MNETRERLTLRASPEFKQEIERVAGADGQSTNEFLTTAVRFYLDHRAAQSNELLPRAITAAIDGRLGMFENRMASLLYKVAVEQDMGNGMLADALRIDVDDLRRRRAESVQNVKRTNGRISLEQRVRDVEDEWQG